MEYDLFAARRRSPAQPGHDPVPGDLAHLSPLGWEHINLNGGLPLGNIADPRSRPIPAAPHRRPCSRLACLKFRFVSSSPGADIDQGHRCVREYSARLLGHSPTIVPAVVWASQQWPGGKGESRLLGFPCFPYSANSMASFGYAYHKIIVTAKAGFREQDLPISRLSCQVTRSAVPFESAVWYRSRRTGILRQCGLC
jgi:hypothetical protein